MTVNVKTGQFDVAPVTRWVPPKKRETIVRKISIADYSTYVAPRADLKPIGQRNSRVKNPKPHGPKATKSQSIISAIFDGAWICEIQLAVRKKSFSLKKLLAKPGYDAMSYSRRLQVMFKWSCYFQQ